MRALLITSWLNRRSVSGTNLLGGGSFVSQASIAGVLVDQVLSANGSQIVLQAADASPTVGQVLLVADTGAFATGGPAFTYVASGVVATIEPAFGQEGTVVTVSGAGKEGIKSTHR